jgi:hypothetical protein
MAARPPRSLQRLTQQVPPAVQLYRGRMWLVHQRLLALGFMADSEDDW